MSRCSRAESDRSKQFSEFWAALYRVAHANRLMKRSWRSHGEHREHPENPSIKLSKTITACQRLTGGACGDEPIPAKCCKLLSDLLEMRRVTSEAFAGSRTPDEYGKVLQRRDVRNVVSRLSRLRKGDRVGINIMDITVCGAVAPYNALLDGKLMCLLLCSPEVGKAYADRYAAQPSLIASCMKGTPTVRRSRLVVVGTTSLYGHSSNQYNRLKIPMECLSGVPGATLEIQALGAKRGLRFLSPEQ